MSDGDAAEEIMCATYCALCEHGYADLTMRDIADESTKSKAALHYHYDSKHELLCAFLEYLYARFVERTADPDGEDARERLLSLVDAVLDKPDDREAFGTAILEIRAQAPYEPEFRERLSRINDYLHDEIAAVLKTGVDDGTFGGDIDPDETARFIVTVLTGAATERVTTGRPFDCTRETLEAYVEAHLLADPQEVEA